MNLTTINFKNNFNLNKNKSMPKYELPFIKVTIQGKKGETTQIIRKLNNSKKYIKDHLDKLLFTGFKGTLDDFYKVYGIKKKSKDRKNKGKTKLNSSLLLKSDLFFKPIQKTQIKEFNFMNKIKEKSVNIKTLLNILDKKNDSKYIKLENNENFKNKSSFEINSKNISRINLDLNKSNFYQKISNFNNDSMVNKEKIAKMKKIYKIRKLLNQKSRNILKSEDNLSLQRSTFETLRENKENIKKEKKNVNDKDEKNFQNLRRIQLFRNILEKNLKKKEKTSTEIINETFSKLLNKKEDDKIQFKKILDPLSKAFKSHLKEIQKFEGKDKHSLWIKKSTANLVSFGNSFQIMEDETFYKDHKRIISKYPDLEREANIPVPEKKVREENKIIEKMEYNERKIKNIINDSDNLLKIIKTKYLIEKNKRHINSQSTIRKKKKF